MTHQIQGQNMVTSSLAVNCVRGLRAALARLHEVYKSKLVYVLQSSTETRLNKFESMEAFQLAATLDPRYKLDWYGDPLGYCKAKQPEFPVLTRLAAKYLAIPATSAPVERLFSIASKLLRPERCNLRDNRFEQLMMIRCDPQ
ncbi:hypothetical protein Hamer_G026071 [Homarus americanus]|uniref:HAT C-terminal dimerisation domain-containing protein n=1 Tax=Homarus americanus TaxID=6706 RepID=A0A8J5K2H6_HOMAM|nr:hypothetical protein Hamer_G026071 [Homarus americanus]